MSAHAAGWAWEQQVPPLLKFVLVALAESCGPGDEPTLGITSFDGLRSMVGMSADELQACLDDLIARELLAWGQTHPDGWLKDGTPMFWFEFLGMLDWLDER